MTWPGKSRGNFVSYMEWEPWCSDAYHPHSSPAFKCVSFGYLQLLVHNFYLLYYSVTSLGFNCCLLRLVCWMPRHCILTDLWGKPVSNVSSNAVSTVVDSGIVYVHVVAFIHSFIHVLRRYSNKYITCLTWNNHKQCWCQVCYCIWQQSCHTKAWFVHSLLINQKICCYCSF